MKNNSTYSKEHASLRNLVRLYVLAGDLKGEERKSRQKKIKASMKKVKWHLMKIVGREIGMFASFEWFRQLDDYIRGMKILADAGDRNLPNRYRKGLNILIANKDKCCQFIKERFKPSAEELENVKNLLMADIVSTSGYIRCRDRGLMADELQHWSMVRSVNAQFGEIMDRLIEKQRRDEHERGTDISNDTRRDRHGNGDAK